MCLICFQSFSLAVFLLISPLALRERIATWSEALEKSLKAAEAILLNFIIGVAFWELLGLHPFFSTVQTMSFGSRNMPGWIETAAHHLFDQAPRAAR